MMNQNNNNKKWMEKIIQKCRFKGAESSSRGAFINNVVDSPVGWG